MATLHQNISLWVNDAEKALVNEYVSSGRKASGNWAKQLTDEIIVTQTNINVKILGEKYTGAMVNGRKPNTKQSEESIKAFVGWAGSTFLSDWVEQKGIIANPYAIAYSIARDGIKVPNRYNDGKLLDNVFTEQRINDLIKLVGRFFSVQLSSEVINSLKK